MTHAAAGKAADDGVNDAVVALSTAALRDLGIEVEAVDDPEYGDVFLLGPDGERYFLQNLVAACRTLPESEWSAHIGTHFARHLEGRSAPDAEELSEPDLLTEVRTRLQPVEVGADPQLSMTYARRFSDDLVTHLCRDLPTTVETLTDSSLQGRDLDLLYQAGQRNTDAEPYATQQIPVDGTPGITALVGDSFFIATKALNMRRIIATELGEAEHGVVFSVPHRHLLMVHPVTNLKSTLAVKEMVGYTLGQVAEAPGGNISPHTYFWYGDQVQQITRIDPDENSMVIESQGMFGDALALFS